MNKVDRNEARQAVRAFIDRRPDIADEIGVSPHSNDDELYTEFMDAVSLLPEGQAQTIMAELYSSDGGSSIPKPLYPFPKVMDEQGKIFQPSQSADVVDQDYVGRYHAGQARFIFDAGNEKLQRVADDLDAAATAAQKMMDDPNARLSDVMRQMGKVQDLRTSFGQAFDAYKSDVLPGIEQHTEVARDAASNVHERAAIDSVMNMMREPPVVNIVSECIQKTASRFESFKNDISIDRNAGRKPENDDDLTFQNDHLSPSPGLT